jgi:ribosomal protein L32E
MHVGIRRKRANIRNKFEVVGIIVLNKYKVGT